MEQSMFFIKPEAIKHRKKIFKLIEGEQLTIVEKYEATITCAVLWGLYKHVPEKFFERVKAQLLGKMCLLGIVRGEEAIERLVRISGSKNYAEDCQPGTIRFIFGDRRPGMGHLNAIHRPKTAEEAASHLALFREYGLMRQIK